jgi:hypothetical protein
VAEQRSGSAADQVRAVLEAAEQVRAQAEVDAERTRGAVDRVGERAEELGRRLDELAAAVTEAIAGLREELEALHATEAAEPEAAPAADDELIAEAEAAAAREPEVKEAPAPDAPAPDAPTADEPAPDAPTPEGARLLALKMALDGRPREETAAYLRENFALDDPEALLDEVYAQAGS